MNSAPTATDPRLRAALRYGLLKPLLRLLQPLSGARVQPGFTF